MKDKIKTIEHMRAEYQSKDAHERSAYMEEIGAALRKHDIDPWLIICEKPHWEYIKKIETVEQFNHV